MIRSSVDIVRAARTSSARARATVGFVWTIWSALDAGDIELDASALLWEEVFFDGCADVVTASYCSTV